MNVPEGMMVDHRNHNTLDNRKINLRITGNIGNCRNRSETHNLTGFKGVRKSYTNKHGNSTWTARICKGNRKVSTIGSYKSSLEAAKAYDKAAIKYFGEYALLNFGEGVTAVSST